MKKSVKTRQKNLKRRQSKPDTVYLSQPEWDAYFAAHNQRLTAMDAVTKTLQDDLRIQRAEQMTESRFLHKRIDDVSQELTDKIDTVRTDLTEKIDAVQTEVSAKLDQNTDAIKSHFDESLKPLREAHKQHSERLRALEHWRVFIAGVSFVIAGLVVHFFMRVFSGPFIEFMQSLFFQP